MLPLLTWLIQGAAGPALVGLPVTWAASSLARAAGQWFRRLRRSDGLSRIVRAAAHGDLGLSDAEFAAVRDLMGQESTWLEVGRGTVEDLAALVASRLPGRTPEASLAAGRAIAAGLLEFAVRDLEPEWFSQVLFARLDRMQADQASALDRAMLSVHADLAALLAHQDAADAERSARVIDQLTRVLDRLPPGPADQGEVVIYLARLISWLNADPWPQDVRFAGPTLTPAVIERKLRVASGRGKSGQVLEADDLARRCVRLVILGGPGSGKTWLAKRTARLCAEAALRRLAAGELPDEVELPLYTTCARLSGAPPGDGIRRAVVSSALAQLPDLGGSRVIDALRVLFEARNAPTLLVVDSIDEARGADDRLRQADTLPSGWRIVLTSRPASWNRQLAIGASDPVRRVGLLQPLRYPDDVEPFIAEWFSARPAWGTDLATQLRSRPALQPAATVPLILAFFCIVGGGQPLPGRRHELNAKVIRRMLTGRWRSSDRDPDPETCLETLRDWAWSAAASNPVSGIGAWADEFPTPRVRQSQEDRDALDHVAASLGPADADSGMTWRRMVHRSIREHLVAEHVALRMSADEAANELMNHLWYDQDWEYAAPAALAMHPQREKVLREVISRLTREADIAAIDGSGEIYRFLARVAQESSERDWSAEAAEIIGRARLDLAISRQETLWQLTATDWPTSNRLIVEWLLRLLADQADLLTALELADPISWFATTPEHRAEAMRALLWLLADEVIRFLCQHVANAVARLAATAEDLSEARQALLGLLAGESSPGTARELADAVVRLTASAQDRAEARQALLRLLAGESDQEMARVLADAVAQLDPAAQDLADTRQALLRLLAGETGPVTACELADAVARLDPAPQDRAEARRALLRLLTSQTSPWIAPDLADAVARLDPAPQDRAEARQVLLRLLGSESSPEMAKELACALARLANTAQDRTEARQALLRLLTSQTNPGTARELAGAVARLDPAPQDQVGTRGTLLRLLADQTDAKMALELADAASQLAATTEDRSKVLRALLRLLAREPNAAVAGELADAVARLPATAQDRAEARQALLRLVADQTSSWVASNLLIATIRLAATAADRAEVRLTLLGLLASESDPEMARLLAHALAGLDPAAQDLVEARQALLRLLTSAANPHMARMLTDAFTELAATAEDRAQARQALLQMLTSQTSLSAVLSLADAVARLDPAAQERAEVRRALLGLLASESSLEMAGPVVDAVTQFAATAQDRAEVRRALLGLLRLVTSGTAPLIAPMLVDALIGLAATAQDRAEVRQALLGFLASATDPQMAQAVASAVARLDPGAQDRAEARQVLFQLLTSVTNAWMAGSVADVITRLAGTAEERAEVRLALLRLLADETYEEKARALAYAIIELSPVVADLVGADTWPCSPTPQLLAAARQNSELSAWLTALPLISRPTCIEPASDGTVDSR